MKSRRLAWILLLSFSAAACARRVITADVTQPILTAHDTTTDKWAVYTAVLDSLYHVGGQSPALIVIRDSIFGMMYCPPGANLCEGLPPHRTAIAPDLLKMFPYIVSRQRPLAIGPYRIPIVRYSQEGDFQRLHGGAADSLKEEMMRTQLVDMWAADALAFRKWFKGAWGVSTFSDVAFDSLHTQAVVQLRHHCLIDCFHAEDIVLARTSRGWKVQERILDPNPHSQNPPFPPLLYIGPDATPHPQPYRENEFTGPRSIRGVVTTKDSENAVPNLPVVLITSHMVPWTRVVTDAFGQFRIVNPPFRLAMIEAECSVHPGRTRQTLGFHDVYVRPGMDTVINFQVDLRDCLERPPVRRLDVELAPDAHAIYPDSTAAGVYRAAIDMLYPAANSPSLIVLSGSTKSRCHPYYGCLDLQLAQLQSSGELDAEIVRQFTTDDGPSLAINHAFSTRHIALFDSSAERYIGDEAEARVNGGYSIDDSTDALGSIFRRAYPGATEVVKLSKVSFNRDTTTALMHIQHGTLSGSNDEEILLFKKTGGGWVPRKRHIEKIRVTGAYSAGRCIPVEEKALDPRRGSYGLSGRFAIERVNIASMKPTDAEWSRSRSVLSLKPISDYRERFYVETPSGPRRNAWDAEFIARGVLISDSVAAKNAERKPAMLFAGRGLLRLDVDLSGNETFGIYYEITRATPDGFFGTWQFTSNTVTTAVTTSLEGRRGIESHGFFCARHIQGP
jgi:hypothetical protein